jgi:hypothetical protein
VGVECKLERCCSCEVWRRGLQYVEWQLAGEIADSRDGFRRTTRFPVMVFTTFVAALTRFIVAVVESDQLPMRVDSQFAHGRCRFRAWPMTLSEAEQNLKTRLDITRGTTMMP